jgi:glycosyltransferase involved in cell wall biosynthesis
VKILFANEYLGYFGGVEQNVAFVADALRRRGHECWLVHRAVTDKAPEAYRQLFAGTFSSPDLGAQQGEKLALLVDSLKPDVIYLHRVPTIAPFVDLECRRVRMIHDHDLCCPRRHKYYLWNSRVCHQPAGWRCWFDLAFLERDDSKIGFRYLSIPQRIEEMRRHNGLDRLLVASRFMQDELLVNGFSPSKVGILAPVVPLTPATPSPVPAEPRVLYVGQLIRGKGVDLLLRALAALERPYSCDIVGAGNMQDKLVRLAADLGLTDKVRFHGWVDHAFLEELYQRCRLVAVPSRWAEPFGMIGLEAMAHGRPVAGFAAGGIPDWLFDGQNGLLVGELDVPGMTQALRRLLSEHELCQQLGGQGWKIAHSQFSFDSYVERLEEVLAPV